MFQQLMSHLTIYKKNAQYYNMYPRPQSNTNQSGQTLANTSLISDQKAQQVFVSVIEYDYIVNYM